MFHILRKYFSVIFLIVLITFVEMPLAGDTLKEAKKAYSQRQFQKSIKLFQEHARKHSGDGEPYMFLGYIFELQKDYELSNAYFRKAVDLKLKPNQKKTCLLKLMIYYNYHRAFDYVVHYGNRYLKIDPHHHEVTKMRDKAIANRGQDTGHISTAINTEKRDKDKDKEIRKDNEKDKDKEVKKHNEKDKDKEVKKKNKKKEEEISEEETEIETTSKEDQLWEKALKFMSKEDYVSAYKNLKKLLIINPDNRNYLYKAGLAKLRLGNFEEAIHFFDKAKKNTPESDKMILYYIYLNQGQAYQKISKNSIAIEKYRKAFNLNNSAAPLYALTKLKYEANEFEGSQKYAELLLKFEPENLEGLMYQSVSMLQLGNKPKGHKGLLEFAARLKKEFPDLSKANEKYQEGILYLGVFYSNRIKYRLALKYLKLAKSRMDRLSYKFALGKSYYYLKKYELALIELEKLPDVPAANYLIARYYASINNLEKTKEYFSKAAKGKEIYWIKIKLDNGFKDAMQNQEFAEFINNKGEKPKTVIKEEPVPVIPVKPVVPETPVEIVPEKNIEPIVTPDVPKVESDSIIEPNK
jgi:tetratricopeptide (TPR) repeat protein